MRMPVLNVWQGGSCREILFNGTPSLSALLQQHGITAPHPCGGRGSCGKCALRAQGSLSPPTAAEEAAGTRLSCQIRLLGDADIWLREDAGAVETAGNAPVPGTAMEGLFGAAIDIGTTTIALKLFDLRSGALLAQAGTMNPQRSIAADVMGRIGAAMAGQHTLLQSMATEALRNLLENACIQAGIGPADVDALESREIPPCCIF